MRWLDRLLFRLRPLFGRRRIHEEIDEEIRFHVEMEAEKYIKQGMDPAEARREAMRRFGGVERFKEEVRDVDGVSWMEKLWTDGRYGLRMLRKNPVFALVAILTLALGIGASTAIFSVVDGILLRELPYDDPDELVIVWADYTERGGPYREWLSYPNYHDAAELDVFEELAIYFGARPTLTGDGPPTMIQGSAVGHGMFSDVLRVDPVLGRSFQAEDHVPQGPRVVLLSYGTWQNLFGGDPDVVGRDILLSEMPTTVIGVMPEDFRPPFGPEDQLWLPIQLDLDSGGGRGAARFRTVGRLAEGVTLSQARSELSRLGARLREAYPEANTGVGYALVPLHEDVVRTAETALWVLLGAVGFVLLLVCVNLANLILSRGASRTGEMAVRASLGASRKRLVRQLVTESTILAAVGGLVGMAVAYGGVELLISLAPGGTPRIDEVAVDGRVLGFAALVTLGSGILFGLLPAIRVSAADLRSGLTEGGRGSQSRGRNRARATLVGAQMAVALILLVGAGLLIRSFQELHRVDLGFEPQGVLAAFLTLNPDRYPDADSRLAFVNELERRLASIPGVRSVGFNSTLPMAGFDGDVNFQIEGRPAPPPGQEDATWVRRVTPDYFEAMGIPLLAGRPFEESDSRDEARVVIINKTTADHFFPGESPLGKRLNVNDPRDPVWREIVGVAKDVKNFGIKTESRFVTYFPYAQVPNTALFLVLRAATENPESLLPQVRRHVADLDPQLAVAQPTSMEDQVSRAMGQDRFLTTLLALFAGVALTLAAVGLYGVVAYGVNQRMRELGVRIALGAEGFEISKLVIGRSLLVALGGLTVGLAGALALTRLMENVLFGVAPTDPVTFTVTGGVLLAAALLASAVPALRAARVDPVKVLRVE